MSKDVKLNDVAITYLVANVEKAQIKHNQVGRLELSIAGVDKMRIDANEINLQDTDVKQIGQMYTKSNCGISFTDAGTKLTTLYGPGTAVNAANIYLPTAHATAVGSAMTVATHTQISGVESNTLQWTDLTSTYVAVAGAGTQTVTQDKIFSGTLECSGTTLFSKTGVSVVWDSAGANVFEGSVCLKGAIALKRIALEENPDDTNRGGKGAVLAASSNTGDPQWIPHLPFVTALTELQYSGSALTEATITNESTSVAKAAILYNSTYGFTARSIWNLHFRSTNDWGGFFPENHGTFKFIRSSTARQGMWFQAKGGNCYYATYVTASGGSFVEWKNIVAAETQLINGNSKVDIASSNSNVEITANNTLYLSIGSNEIDASLRRFTIGNVIVAQNSTTADVDTANSVALELSNVAAGSTVMSMKCNSNEKNQMFFTQGGNKRAQIRTQSFDGISMARYSSSGSFINNAFVLDIDGRWAFGDNIPNQTIAASSAFEIRSTSGGFLPPRLTTAQRDGIGSPATGLIAWNSTTSKLQNYDGSNWADVAGAAVTAIANNDTDVTTLSNSHISFNANSVLTARIFETGMLVRDSGSSTGGINTCATFETRGTTGGLLLPRMSTTARDAISTPVAGLVVYDNSVNQISFRGGGAYKYLASMNDTVTFSSQKSTVTAADAAAGVIGAGASGASLITGGINIGKNIRVKETGYFGSGSLDASAILELSSTTAGFLPSRMTTTQRDAIGSPATGLVLWNSTTDTLQNYDGVAWGDIASASASILSGTSNVTCNASGNVNIVSNNAFTVNVSSTGVLVSDTHTANASPHSSALMQFSSTTRAILMPKMTTVERDAIGSPQKGSIVFNNDTNRMNFRNSSGWFDFYAPAQQLIQTSTQESINSSSGAIYTTGGLGVARNANFGDQVGVGNSLVIGATAVNASASAALEVVSTTKGVLPPRMTNAQMRAISAPADGLMVHDTTREAMCVYHSSAWNCLPKTIYRESIMAGGNHLTANIVFPANHAGIWCFRLINTDGTPGSSGRTQSSGVCTSHCGVKNATGGSATSQFGDGTAWRFGFNSQGTGNPSSINLDFKVKTTNVDASTPTKLTMMWVLWPCLETAITDT